MGKAAIGADEGVLGEVVGRLLAPGQQIAQTPGISRVEAIKLFEGKMLHSRYEFHPPLSDLHHRL